MLSKVLRSISPTLHRQVADIRQGRFELYPPRRTYAERDLHRLLKSRFAGRKGVYLEAGANNGVVASNTLYLEKHYGWSGILVEPIPICSSIA